MKIYNLSRNDAADEKIAALKRRHLTATELTDSFTGKHSRGKKKSSSVEGELVKKKKSRYVWVLENIGD